MASKDETLKDRRRRQIVDATIEAIYHRGIADVRLADIARAAGVSYGVVSFYFKSKDALILATMNHVAREYSEAMKVAAADDSQAPMERLLAAIAVNFTPSISDPAKTAVWVALWAQSHVVPSFRKRCCELQDEFVGLTEPLCRQIIEEGGHTAIDPHRLAQVFCIMMSGLDIEMHLRGRGYSVESARRTFEALLGGIFPEELASVQRTHPPRRRAAAARSAKSARRQAPARKPRAR